MLQNEVKSLLMSKTVWGALVSLAATALAAGRHVAISPADQSVIVDVIIQAIAASGALAAIWGRSVAVKKIGMVLLLILGGMLFNGGSAGAQTKRATVIPTPVSKPAALTQTQAKSNPLQVLQTFTVNDLQAALADAQAQTPPDQAAINCYTALIPLVQTGVANPLPQGLGAFQALQKARDAKALLANIQSPNGQLAALNIACAPLLMDVNNTLLQLGIVGGTVAATGGLGVTLPAFLGGILPFPLPGL